MEKTVKSRSRGALKAVLGVALATTFIFGSATAASADWNIICRNGSCAGSPSCDPISGFCG